MREFKAWRLAAALSAVTLVGDVSAADFEHDDALALIELIDTLNQEALSLPQAIEVALKEQPGLVQEARVEWNDERIHFEIEITSGRDVYQLEIDPTESKVRDQGLNLGETVVNHMASSGDFIFGGNSLSAERQDEITAMLKAGLAQIEGKPIALSLEEERGRIFYEVQTLDKGRLSTAVISGQTGKIIFYRHYSNDG